MHVLAIDDIRNFADADFICRTADSGIEALLNKDWDFLYIDHDLGEEKSGYDVLVEVSEIRQHPLPKKINIVSMNPVGLEKIGALLKNLGYCRWLSPRLWYK